MPIVPGLGANIRYPTPEPDGLPDPVDIVVSANHDNGDIPEYDDRGAVIRITHGDGSVTVSLDGKPIEDAKREPKGWFDNLVEEIDDNELSRISWDLVRGIDDDIRSRQEWIEERAQGIRLLGLKIEIPGLQGASDGAPVEGMSKVRHPLLQEACLRFQANARSELLPTDGPVKVRNDNNNATLDQDSNGNALEKDLNHFLTTTASEYYPDTDRMLLMLGFGGTAFKKVYFCPLRNRPASESVDAEDLIVNNQATDLRNAKRVTHRSYVGTSFVKQMQILGHYRDIDLSTPLLPKLDAAQIEKLAQQGVSNQSMTPDDRDREIYECYCELDIKGYEHEWKGKVTGLEIPYTVTIDVSTKQILSIVRNYDEPEDGELPEKNSNIVKYTFVPGFGFYDIGLLHILGNTTNAVTAGWRELLDSGMYACFPGFLMADNGMRQNTNIFRIPPGGGAQVKTGGMPIQEAIMPLPYNSQGAPALMQLIQEMTATGMRVGGTAEQPVGEGRNDAPVGTTLALIEQATKITNSVHKRMHAAQCEEFRMLVECFKRHPKSFWQSNKRPARKWDEETFLKALDDCDLTPQADPNTASQLQRILKLQALKSLQIATPMLYNQIVIDTACIKAIGYSNPDQFFAPPSAMGRQPPEAAKALAEGQAKTVEAQAKQTIAQAKSKEADAKSAEIAHRMATPQQGDPGPSPVDQANAQARLMDAHTKAKQVEVQRADTALHDANSQEDRKSKEQLQLLELARDIVLHPSGAPVAEPIVKDAEKGDDER